MNGLRCPVCSQPDKAIAMIGLWIIAIAMILGPVFASPQLSRIRNSPSDGGWLQSLLYPPQYRLESEYAHFYAQPSPGEA